MIRKARPADKQAVRELWQHAFGDTEEYAGLWFSEFYPKVQGLVYEKEGSVLGALQLLPVTLRADAREHTGYYVGGVSVWELYRHRKIGTALMQAAEEAARRDGMEFCILIADAVGYYEQFGYRALSHRSVIAANPSGEAVSARPVRVEDGEELLLLYRAFCERYPVYQRRTAAQMTDAARLECASRGGAVRLPATGELLGAVYYDTWEDTLYADEILWKNEEGKRLALRFLHEFGKKEISFRCAEPVGILPGTPSVMLLPVGEWKIPSNGYYNITV